MERRALVLLVWAGVAFGGLAWAEAPVYYVATNGNDAWSGKLAEPDLAAQDGPFASLTRARDALRACGTEKGLPEGGRVYVRGGVYYLDAPLELGPPDSGTAEQPVIWQAYRMEPVRLVGGRRVEAFAPYKDQIVQAPLADVTAPLGQLFFNSIRQIPARWPNKGADDMPGGAWAFVASSVDTDKKRCFVFAGDRPAGWAVDPGIQVSIWPNYNWWQTIANVARIDAQNHLVELSEALPYTIEPGRRFFVQNVFEELDAPGEWYYQIATSTLYFWPPQSMENAEIVVPRIEQAIRMENAAHVNLIAFTVEATRGDGVVLTGCENCLVARCAVRNTGGFGISVSGGKEVRVHGNDIYENGRGGLVLSGGDRKTLTPANHQAVNNHIHDFGRLYQTYQTGVNIEGVGNRVANNLIHDAPHIGILLTGNDHMIELNEIHHVCLEGSDNGAFYMGRDWTQRGNIIRYNKFHDVYGFGLAGLGPDESGAYRYESPHQAWGVYLDDCSSGSLIHGNVFYRVPLCGVMIGGGRDNVVSNNIFFECVPALHIDARWDEYCWDIMQERLDAMNYRQPPFSTRYPELLKMGDDPRKPQNNRFVRNVIAYKADQFRGLSTTEPREASAVLYDLDQFDPETTVMDKNLLFHFDKEIRVAWHSYKTDDAAVVPLKTWQNKGFDAGSLIADPKFLNPDADDYWLPKYSPAVLNLKFESIPMERIGLYHDEFRASWPVDANTRREGANLLRWTVTIQPSGSTVQSPEKKADTTPLPAVLPGLNLGDPNSILGIPIIGDKQVIVSPEFQPAPAPAKNP